jgi:Bacteriophage HK97-gp10, putative tail-component
VPVDADDTIAALTAMMGRVRVASRTIVAKSALELQRVGMAHTHVRSGTLRRSWRIEPFGEGGMYGARVGPTTVYARRQELGFKGPDKLGRVFKNDPGWPYVKPTFVQVAPQILRYAIDGLSAALRG